jgi:hypothetical protein
MLLVGAIMAIAVAVYAGVAVGHNGNGNGNSGNQNGKNEDHHNQGNKGEHHRGKHRGNAVFEASLAPSHIDDPPIHGVNPGGLPWVLDRGRVKIKAKGRLELRVRGLVIPSPQGDNTPGGVKTISASLFCGAGTDTAPADTTDQVPIDQNGNARIRDKSFNVQDTCLAPIVLVHPNGDLTHYIAVSGWRTSS